MPKEDPVLGVINHLIDLIFFMDIIGNFRTTYIDKDTGLEVKDIKLIQIHYLQGMFSIDLLATIPFYELISIFATDLNSSSKMLSMLKLIRVARLSRVINYMNTTDDVKLSL